MVYQIMEEEIHKTLEGHFLQNMARSKHGWGTQKDYVILYSLDSSLKHVVET
jgi:hypothetical protein